ncbi:MAG: SUMF1/EgtB/PvdO family nonheme iron enzyme [Cyanobacteriota bacterium]
MRQGCWSARLLSWDQSFATAPSPIASDRTDGSPRDSVDANPRVFLSYSHDSEAHRAWVRQLAERLRANGVDVILDQWDLRAGADVVRFMERGIVEAARVLLVCTANYVAKAEERKGGAGYEGMVVTGQVADATDTIKFVPIVRDNGSASPIPAFLGKRLWLDFRDDRCFEESFRKLLHDLHEVPEYPKPPLGPSPFAAPPRPATPSPNPPSALPPLRPVEITTAQLRREGSEWLLDRRGLSVKGFQEELGNEGSLWLLEIPAGRFWMGSPRGEQGRHDDEGPPHEVRLERFFLSQTPITQAQWREVAGWEARTGERWNRALDPNPSWFQGRAGQDERWLVEGEANTDRRPVERVSWHDAMEFCSRLRQRTGRSYALPSEAQWEYACRAGTTTPFHFGSRLTTALANCSAERTSANGPEGWTSQQTTPVGRFPANAWGLLDMHGNVWEWCLDHWHNSYAGAPTDGSAWLDEGGLNAEANSDKPRLLRGGSWRTNPRNCRSAYRYRNPPVSRLDSRGFRVCCLPQD